MKKSIILFLKTYQRIISPLLHQLLGIKSACRFSPTCSEYAITAVSQKGAIKGTCLSLVRLLKCQPFYNN